MATTTTKPKISLKLLVDTNSRKVLFAEARKDFVDFLFGLLELPFGTILSLLVDHGMSGSGSVCKIYDSVKNLNNDYFQSNQTKNYLLRPKIANAATASNTKHTLLKHFSKQEGSSNSTVIYSQSSYQYGASPPMVAVVEGYVKGVVTYMVKDDLVVQPMSNISSISLLSSMGVQNLSSVEEKTVEVDLDKGLKLLKTSFESSTVLTDVFLRRTIPTF